LRYEVDKEIKAAKRRSPLPPRSIRSGLAAPTGVAITTIVAASLALIGLSVLLALGHVHLSLLPTTGDRISVYTSMWQVQAGIAALALPVLIFVIERARDERQAALHTAEVLGRESWSWPIIAFAFVGVARMGIDLTLFSGEQLVFLSDVGVLLLTVLLTLFAYFRVLRVILRPSLLRDRSILLASEKTRDVLLESVRLRIANNKLFQNAATFGVGYWPFGGSEDADHFVLRASGEWTAPFLR
jgi:hypothetical protein